MTLSVLNNVQEKSEAAGAAHLGTLFWWDLANNNISHGDLELAADHQGFPREYLPAQVKPHQAFKRAVSHAETMVPKGILIRKIKDDKKECVIGIVSEIQDIAMKDLKYKTLSVIEFDKVTSHITNGASHDVVKTIHDLYIRHLNHDTDDIRKIMANFLNRSGVALRQSGGVYFIPAQFQPVLDSMCRLIEAVGSNATYQLKQFDTVATRMTLTTVATKSLDDEIRQMQEELDKFAFEKARKETLEGKLDGFEELRARVNLFSGVLNFKADVLNSKINKIKKIVQGHLDPDMYHDDAEETVQEKMPITEQIPFSQEAGF